jgi:hypothetical protein
MTNTLAYSGTESITALKSYIVQALRLTENLKMEFKKLFFPDLRNFKKTKTFIQWMPEVGTALFLLVDWALRKNPERRNPERKNPYSGLAAKSRMQNSRIV